MVYRGGYYNIGISVYFQAMFIEYQGIYKRSVAWRSSKKIHEKIGLWWPSALYIFRKCFVGGDQREHLMRKLDHTLLNNSGKGEKGTEPEAWTPNGTGSPWGDFRGPANLSWNVRSWCNFWWHVTVVLWSGKLQQSWPCISYIVMGDLSYFSSFEYCHTWFVSKVGFLCMLDKHSISWIVLLFGKVGILDWQTNWLFI